MKRGFLLAILSLFIVITFGGFGMPEKGHASTLLDDLNAKLVVAQTNYNYCTNANPGKTTTQLESICVTPFNALNAAKQAVLNETNTPTAQIDINNFYKDCMARGGTATSCGEALTAANLQNNGGVLPEAQATVNQAASNLYLAESTAQVKYIACAKKNGPENCLSEFKTYNDATAAVNAFAQQAQQSGYTLTNSSQRVSPNIPEFKKTCGFFDSNSSILACVTDGFDWFIRTILLTIGSWFLAMGSALLDWSITYGILNFSQWVPPGITSLWKLVRDVLYLCIVFIGFYLAFMYIIGRDEKFKKFIPWLIMFALFVNFSLPISKAMIDMSNIVALNIYSSALGNETSAGTTMMERIGLQTMLSDSAKTTTTISASILAVIFVFFGAWVFFQIAIMMMVRTVILTLCLIGSPFLLIDAMVTIPFFGEKVKQVRSAFFNQLFMADVFMIMFFIALQIMTVLKKLPPATISASAPALGNVSLIFGIFMMLMLLHFMLKITKSMSGEVGSIATGFVNSGVGMLAGGAMGATALAGRVGIGGLAARTLANTETGLGGWINRNQDGVGGRMAHSLTNSLANSTFDARNSGIAQKYSGKLGMNIGTGGKTGYQQNLDAKIKDRMERGARITTINKDGTVNQAGVEAKRKFYDRAGGVMMNKDKVREALMEKDVEEATTDDSKFDTKRAKTISDYSKLKGDDRREFFNRQDSATQAVLQKKEAEEVEIAHGEANEVQKKIKEKEAKEAQRIAEKAAEATAQATRENERLHGEAIEEDKSRTAQIAREARDTTERDAKVARDLAEDRFKQELLNSNKAFIDLMKAQAAQQAQNNNDTTVNANNPGTSSVGTGTA